MLKPEEIVDSHVIGRPPFLEDILKAHFEVETARLFPSWENWDNLLTENEEGEDEYQDILEYWQVTGWLYHKLKERGEPVLEWEGHYFWGRTTSGQAICLDWVIQCIANPKLEPNDDDE